MGGLTWPARRMGLPSTNSLEHGYMLIYTQAGEHIQELQNRPWKQLCLFRASWQQRASLQRQKSVSSAPTHDKCCTNDMRMSVRSCHEGSCLHTKAATSGAWQAGCRAAWPVLNYQGRNKHWHWIPDASGCQVEGLNSIFKTASFAVRCRGGSTQKNTLCLNPWACLSCSLVRCWM